MSDIDRDGSLDADEFAVVSAGLVPNTHSHALSLPLPPTLTHSLSLPGYEDHYSHQARRSAPYHTTITNLTIYHPHYYHTLTVVMLRSMFCLLLCNLSSSLLADSRPFLSSCSSLFNLSSVSCCRRNSCFCCSISLSRDSLCSLNAWTCGRGNGWGFKH